MARKDLFLEESILDDLSEGLDAMEQPFSRNAFRLLGFLVVALVIIIFARVGTLAFIKGSFYRERALANAGRTVLLKAPRGILYDRFGTALVSNDPSFGVSLNLSELFRGGTSEEVLADVNAIIPLDIPKIRADLALVDLERQAYYVLTDSLSLQQVVALKNLNRKELFINEGFSRRYEEGPIFSHILGYTGLVSREEMTDNKSLKLNDRVGKMGLEGKYDDILRGRDGFARIFQDSVGTTIDRKVEREPESGENVYTSIDADLQRYFYESLSNQLHQLGRTSGAGLVLNPQTGEVLAMVSIPSYDNNKLASSMFVDKSRPLFNRIVSGVYSPGSTIKPLVAFAALEEGVVDALRSIYSAGYIELPNPYFPDKPSRFVDWKAHGWVNVYSALARSSNVYFYEVGGGFSPDNVQGLGIARLKQYWEKFKLDEPTGIDLNGEASGFLPDPESKERRTGDSWRVGDTYNVSIGQGDFMITPLELLRYIGGIATKGLLYEPYLVSQTRDADDSISYNHSSSFETVSANNTEHFNDIELGMLDGVRKDYGTSHMLADIPLTIAAKTGSAQIQNNQKVNAFFVGYNIPPTNTDMIQNDSGADEEVLVLEEKERTLCKLESAACPPIPQQIAVLVLIEDAREGSMNAVPVAYSVFNWYYQNRIVK